MNLTEIYNTVCHVDDLHDLMKLIISQSDFEEVKGEYTPQVGDIVTIVSIDDPCERTDMFYESAVCQACPTKRTIYFIIDELDDEGQRFCSCYCKFVTLQHRRVVE